MAPLVGGHPDQQHIWHFQIGEADEADEGVMRVGEWRDVVSPGGGIGRAPV